MQESRRTNIISGLLTMNTIFWAAGVESACSEGCDALASYHLWSGSSLSFISAMFSTTVENILSHNSQITNPDSIGAGSRLNVPFSCGCVSGEFMGHQFLYQVKPGNYYQIIAERFYSNLTTVEMMMRFNSYVPERIPVKVQLNVTVNCSCGDSRVSKAYGLFITYPLRPRDSLSGIASEFGLPERLLQDYNPGVDFSRGSGLVFVPARNGTHPPSKSGASGPDQNGTQPPSNPSSSGSNGIPGVAIAGTSLVAAVGAISLAACIYFVFYRRKKAMKAAFVHDDQSIKKARAASPKLKGIAVDNSVEFTFKELAAATNDFNISNKIGEGGFGSVYYAKIRGQKTAIKKMDTKASKEFRAELSVLTRVHHLNLVRLIGYCVKGSLFLVYEYVGNGNLSQHLRGREPLPWSIRLQIALDSARGLEYIHEHTVPMYIHRDIKSANILIDGNFRAKVADFGLAKLIEVGGVPSQTGIMGTFGYMPPEYARHGNASLKIDVYAFGVVLFELVSAKEAVVKTNEVITETKALVALFEEAFNQPDQTEALRKLIDPRLGHDYPLDSVLKVAQLAKACTHENPQLRPSVRSIAVALMTLSSATEDWDTGFWSENCGSVHLSQSGH